MVAVILVGAGLGLMLPGDRPTEAAEAVAATSAPSAPAAKVAKTYEPAAPSRKWGMETRLKPGPGGHFHANGLVNGQPVEFIVDTGATTVALTVEDAQRIGLPVDPSAFAVIGTGASGPVRGQSVMIESVSVDGKEVRRLRGAVLEGLGISLLGQSYLSRISEVTMRGGEMVLR